MDHVAIMRPSWGMTERLLSGQKVIESRWYKHRRTPMDMVQPGDMVYFKDAGGPVVVRARVEHVLQFEDLTPAKISHILSTYGSDDGIPTEELTLYHERFKDKRFCMLIFLEHPESVQPFNISKEGFGAMAAWLSAKSINELRVVARAATTEPKRRGLWRRRANKK